jgi:hypothetical protein
MTWEVKEASMNTNANLEATIGVLGFLGTAFVVGLAALLLLHALKTRKLMRAGKICDACGLVRHPFHHRP